MGAEPSKPTSSETSLDRRRRMVHLQEQGWAQRASAAHPGVSPRTVRRRVGRYRAAPRPPTRGRPRPRRGRASGPSGELIRAGGRA